MAKGGNILSNQRRPALCVLRLPRPDSRFIDTRALAAEKAYEFLYVPGPYRYRGALQGMITRLPFDRAWAFSSSPFSGERTLQEGRRARSKQQTLARL
jgi:hypothetical protein